MAHSYQPDPAYLSLGDGYADPVAAADFPEAILRWRNDRAAATVGLEMLDDTDWVDHFGRFLPLKDNLPTPLAQRYHGHQFRSYNPNIGDGRGFLFAEMRDTDSRLLDLGTKGSGTTPHSRTGDGRLTLKGGMREILATEMLEALGANTSKTLSLIETGEPLQRNDEPSPTRSAVMVRLSHGHIRIGSFQRLGTLGEHELLNGLVDWSLETYFGGAKGTNAEEKAAELLSHTAETTANLAADLMVSGFVHGVLNTDNINITGECFDYGPWRFLPEFDPSFTAAYFDHQGLYCYGRQPEAIQWNLYQLAGSMLGVARENTLRPILEKFPEHFSNKMREKLIVRLGLKSRGLQEDEPLLLAFHSMLASHKAMYEQTIFDWYGGGASKDRAASSPQSSIYQSAEGLSFQEAIGAFEPLEAIALSHSYFARSTPCTMLIDEVEAIWSHIDERDDWSVFTDKITEIRAMGEALSAQIYVGT